MAVKEIARELQGKAANLALRMPIAWVNILAGPPTTVDGRTLDGRAQWFLQLLARSGRRPVETKSVAEARAELDTFLPLMAGKALPVGEIIDRTIKGPAGRLRIRLYRPAGSVARLLPTILYFHGGGWTIGSLEAYDLPCRFFTARTGCALVAVDYRLAPEHKFPAAIDDAVAARLLREETRPPCLQWLIYPVADLAMDSPSYASCAKGFLLTGAAMAWFRGLYLNDPSEAEDPRASPLKANDLSGLAPALIYTAGFDPLRDEGRAYADRLAAAGVKTIHREFESLIHGFVGMRGALQAAARAMDDMVAGLCHELAQLGR
jgi:acetyl esterase